MADWDQIAARLGRGIPSAVLQREAALGELTTYRVGGPARVLVEVNDAEQLAALAAIVADAGGSASASTDPLEVLIIGRGSNLLVADGGFEGIAVQLGDGFSEVRIEATRVQAGGSASLPVVARQTVNAGLSGFEWAVGVPGSVGGAVRMNAGGHGADMAASLRSALIVDLRTGERRRWTVNELGLGYRSSALDSWHAVADAELQLERGDVERGLAGLAEIVRWRREHQPGGRNAGSVFTNPPGDSAGRLIEAAGCKGRRIGTAVVSPKHANFIQADEGGSADDVRALMLEVQRRVFDHSGLHLLPETRTVGFGDPEGAGGFAHPDAEEDS